MKIGYARLGRLMTTNPGKWGSVGGDVEPPRLLDVLARRHPEDTFYLLGRTPPEVPQEFGLPDNIVNPWIDLDDERRKLMSNPERSSTGLSVNSQRKFVNWVDQRILPFYDDMDALIVWIGQHGSVHAPDIPPINGTWEPSQLVTTQDWAILYGAPVLRGINMFRRKDPLNREEVWLVSDPRNYFKGHDLKWPMHKPILGQYDWKRDIWVQRYGDPRTPEETGFADVVRGTDKGAGTHWRTTSYYTPSGLELGGVLPQHTGVVFKDNFNRSHNFGLFINETRNTSKDPWLRRPEIVRDWVKMANPSWMHGKWTPAGLEVAGIDAIQPLGEKDGYYDLLADTRTTFTTPASGTGWATAKPWEAFSTGTICFRHPAYDDQDNIYGKFDSHVRDWLSPKDPRGLLARLEAVEQNESTWRWLAMEQKKVFDAAVADLRHVRMIEERIWK